MLSRIRATSTETLFRADVLSGFVALLQARRLRFPNLSVLHQDSGHPSHMTRENDRRWSRSSMTIHVVVVETRAPGNKECREDLAVGYRRHGAAFVGQMRYNEQYETRTEDCDFVFVVRKYASYDDEGTSKISYTCIWRTN
mgnify:CR=1 FL=1